MGDFQQAWGTGGKIKDCSGTKNAVKYVHLLGSAKIEGQSKSARKGFVGQMVNGKLGTQTQFRYSKPVQPSRKEKKGAFSLKRRYSIEKRIRAISDARLQMWSPKGAGT